ncbi:hypothetical protein F4820DRAFT_468311 [Hypoxylon rubiginosum]|uniref:Uncharacterized protein n=1 Tax=Hypoxylon rubiginosum TaxID=110542 RepID=A0ACB9Z6D4_9PEZI|nr:hypothetical protein F4820DRAFT_468311 [Hypoxylon rubiginosum]
MSPPVQPQSAKSNWMQYPPKEVPRYDLPDPYVPPTNGLWGAEELVDSYANQLDELGRKIKDANEARKSLYTDSEVRQKLELHSFLRQTYANSAFDIQTRINAWEKALTLQDELEPERQAILKRDKVLINKILLEYKAYTDVRSYEAEASEAQALACLRAEETRKNAKKLTRVERNVKHMFGFSLDRLRSQEPILLSQKDTHPIQSQSPPVPDWFPILRSKFKQLLPDGDIADAFKALLQLIDKLQNEVEYWNRRGGAKSWDKIWHEPNKRWPHEFQRLKGGWWKCRSAPDAPLAERRCPVCHVKPKKTAQQPNRQNPQGKLDTVMECIHVAMEEVAKTDQAVVRQRLQQEQERKSNSSKIHNEVPLHQHVQPTADGPVNSVNSFNYSLLHGLEDPLR